MPLFNKWNNEGATFGIWKITESVEELQTMLTEESFDLVDLDFYKCTSRKLEYLGARVLLKELTGKEYNIAHYPSGKPYLLGSSMNITVSHTKGYIAVGVHPTKEVGIDIERVCDRVQKVSSRFVRADELPGFSKHSKETQLCELLLVWSAKETMFKVINASSIDFLEHLHVAKFVPQSLGVFIGHEYRTSKKRTYAIHYIANPEFVLTYLTTANN